MAFSPPSVDDIEEQPEFAPPAPDAFDMSGVQPTSQERSLMAGATPETYALPPALNPDWDIVRESKGALPLALMGKAAGAIQHHLVAPLATRILSGLKTATAPQAALLNNGRADITPVEEGKPMLNLPRLTPQEMEAATPAERALAGTGESLAGLYEGFTTPENLALLPLGEAKAVQGLFGTQMAASIPESLQAIGTANTPEDEARAYSSLALNLGLTGAIGHSLMKEGVPNAGKNKKTAEVHGDVRSEPINVESEVSPAEGGPGVQPRTATTPQGEVPLSDEHAKLLAQHMTDDHEFELMGNNEVMRADHATGKVKIDPVEFGRWVDNDLKDLSPKEKAAAIKSAFEHEDIHLKTDPEDAEPFWNSLSPFEQYVLKRNYTKGIDAEVSPQNLGFEAIRNRVERAMGLTRNDFVGLALKERWTAKSLDALAHVVSNIRRLKDSELSTSQKATLDKVMENIGAARNAVPTQQSAQDEQQYTEGLFMRRGEDKPEEGKVRLYRGHDGANGGVYWTSDKAYAQRMGAKLEQLDVPADQLPDHAVRNVEGSGTPNAYKLPPELTKGAQDSGPSEVPVHNLDLTADDLVKRKPGDMTAEEMLSLPDDQVKKLFEANQKRGVATQYDSVLAGMKLLPDDAVELKKVRDQLHKEGMQKLQQGLAAGKTDMPAEFGKVIWLNGAIEGALRKGPNYESVTTARRGGPAMRRGKGGKPGEQEDMFGVVTKKGIPGEETQDPAARPSAESMGAVEFPEAQTIFPNDIAFDVNYSAPPYRQITESEAKSGRELGEILTKDARSGGSDLPVSATKRLTVLADKLDGSVHVVSTYPVSRPKGLEPFYGPRKSGKVESSVPAQQPIAYIVDPRIAGKERPNRPIEEVLNRYKPVASILVREPRQNYHMKFSSMEDFQTRFGNEAREIVREHGTGTEGIPMTTVGRTGIREPEFTGMAQQPVSNFQFPREQERLKRRPTDQELKAFHDFFGDSLPSDQVMFETRVVRAASTGSRQMISGLRKLIKLEMATHRSWSGGQALTSVLERLYENLKNSETRSEFVSKTLEQSGPGPAETIPEGRGPRATGARELSTIRSKAPTTVEGAEPGEGAPLPEGTTTLTPVEKLSEEDRKAMEAQVERENRQLISPRVIARQLVERKVPSERYTMSGSKSAFDEPADVEEVTDEESKQGEIFPTREVETTKPNKFEEEEEESQGEGSMSLEGDKGTQMEAFNEKSTASRKPERPAGAYWKRQGPAMLRKAEDISKKVRDYLKVASANISKAGDLSDQLYRLKTSEKADYDLALPVIKSALRVIPESDRPVLMRYADEMQVLKKSDIKLTDAQESIYQTFLKPLLDDNQKMYRDLQKAGVPIGESTYLGRLVQDTHSLYSRLWRGTKQRIVEGSVLGQGASFFKQRVFKALEDDKGNRQLIALVGSGKDTRVISYNKGKADLLGKMPPETLETKGLTPQQIHMQRIVENRRLQALAKLDREEQALMKERDRLDKDPNPDPDRVKGVNERLASINGDYAEVAENYPSQVFDVPRMWRDKSGKMWKFTDATIGEIEGNTNTRYYKEPMSGIITQNMKLKQIYRANQFLDDLKNSPEFKSISRSTNERNVPADWRTVDLQQFHGLRIEPRTADVLDLFAQEQKGPALPLKYVNRLTQFLRNSLFVWNPFVHEPNLLTHWFTARGIEWAKPVGYERMFKSGVASLNDVLTRSRFRDQALRAGAPLLRGMGDINKNVMQLLSKELDSNPSMASKVARGLGYINPLRMIRAFGDSLTWGTNEILTLQLIRETMERTGMSLEDTIAEVGKHMPNYRVPPRVLNSRLVSHVMRNPMLSLWGHYHYGALRSYGEMAKEILSPDSTKTQRLEGLGRVATIGFLMAAVYPTIDDIINKVLKTKGLKMRRAGSATVPSSIIDLMQGKKTPEAVAQSIVTPSPVPAAAAELMFNRNLRTGLPVYDRHIGMDTAKDLGSFAANKISPVEEAGKVFGGKKSGEEFGLGLAGITRTRADSAMSQFGRMADDWMRKNPDPSIREDYKRRTQDVFAESDYQLLRSAVIRGDHSAGQKMVDKLLETRSPNEVARRIKQWQNSPFTGTRKTDRALIEQMTPADLDLWYQAAQERLDISEGMMNHLVEAITKEKK